jgi:hypothetical protein
MVYYRYYTQTFRCHKISWEISKHAFLKYPCDVTAADLFVCSTRSIDNPRLSVSAENTSQKKFTGSDKISEIVNDSDSDGGNFSELSDRDTCKVNSLFSSSSSRSSSSSKEQQVVQPEPDRGRKRTHRALPKFADTDFELGWK